MPKSDSVTTSWPSTFTPATVPGRQAADVLLSHTQSALLAPFLGRENTIAKAAEEADVSVDRMYRAALRFERAGLLSCVGTCTNANGGRSIRVYRSSADQYFIPLRLINPNSDMLRTLRLAFDTAVSSFYDEARRSCGEDDIGLGVDVAIVAGARKGVRRTMVRKREGRYHFAPLLQPDAPPLVLTAGELRLTYDEAKALQRELSDLLGRYQRRTRETNGRPYTYVFAYVPGGFPSPE